MVRLRWRGVAALIACAALFATGCTTTPPKVTSAWPVANAERIVPAPPLTVRWPLTGRPAPDMAATERRPLSVKIENSPAARPQSGLNSADVVYETVTEGGITRFNCLFQSVLPRTVGPVRSARLSDLWVVPQYHALFAFSGASVSVDDAVKKAGLSSLTPDFGVTAPFVRVSSRPAPHNYYLSPAKAYAQADKLGIPTTTVVPKLQFGSAATSSTPIASVSIPFSDSNHVRWTYDPATRSYLRVNDGRAHIDAATGKQVSAVNVVVMWTRYTPASHDKLGSTTFDVELGGQGRASVFRDGQRYDGTWQAGRDAPPRFVASDGTPIKLSPGNTWMQVVALNVNITMR